jgi:UPF0755 protein
MKRTLGWLTLLLTLGLAIRFLWVYETRRPLRTAEANPTTIVVPPGANAETIGRQLQDLGLVRHPLVFRLLVRLHGTAGTLRAGEYLLDGPMSLDDIASALAKGQVQRKDVTIPEGKCIEEIADILDAHGIDANAFVRLAHDPTPIADLDPDARDLEGYLFPDTYDLPRQGDVAAALVARMVGRFREVAEPQVGVLRLHGLTLRRLVTLASIVELETARGEERPRIAAVFLNRLEKGMLLQTDPTVIYALRLAGRWDGNIRKKDLDIDSPYNTYRFPGLPPGPIASPGRDAILAVLHPADGRDLYFVSRNDGTHQFSQTLEEHNRAVERYQKRRAGA